MSTLDGRDARRARVAVSVLFLVNGALMASTLLDASGRRTPTATHEVILDA